jgi:hypothetical protein
LQEPAGLSPGAVALCLQAGGVGEAFGPDPEWQYPLPAEDRLLRWNHSRHIRAGRLPQLDFIAKLAALVPRQRVNLTRFHGLLARRGFPPNSKFCVRVTPAKRGRLRKQRHPSDEHWLDKTPVERHASMTWMQRLERVFNWAHSRSILKPVSAVPGKIIVEASNCCIEEPAVIERYWPICTTKRPPPGRTCCLRTVNHPSAYV